MKGSNIKSKMGRFTYSAGILLAMGGLSVSCEDELLVGQPEWLGSSIYEELEKRGEFTTMLALINDEDVSPKDVNGETANARTLRLTGSRTFFVPKDGAFEAFWKNNPWGVKGYNDLSAAQKKLLFNSSIVQSAYLMELMSSSPTTTDEPTDGVRMRRTTNYSIYDSVPKLTSSDMPDNIYWKRFRDQYPDNGEKKMAVMCDDNPVMMHHFLPSFMSSRSITSDDLAFLTGGVCTSNSDYCVNGRKVIEQDIVCQNGYIQVLDSVPVLMRPMSEIIRKDKDLSVFSSLLDRFSVPVYAGQNATERYNNNTDYHVDSLYIWRYLNSGFNNKGNENEQGLHNSYYVVNGKIAPDVLPFDPGWNGYYDGERRVPSEEDMGVIIAPTNAAFDDFFAHSGKPLYERYYNNVDSIPDNIVVEMLNEFMRASLVATVPSKYGTVNNSAQYPLGLEDNPPFACVLGSNGAVYKTNKVYNVPAYSSVYYPTLLFTESLKIINWAINELAYDAYLKSMDSEYMFIIPSLDALSNYVDPVDFQKSQKTITEFYYDNSQNKVRCRRYNAVSDGNGGWVKSGEPIRSTQAFKNGSTEDDYVKNRMQEILDNCIIVKDKVASGSGQEIWVTKGGMPIAVENAGTAAVRFYTPYRKEVAQAGNGTWEPIELASPDNFYDMGSNPQGNGWAFIVDKEPPMSASKSVITVLEELIAGNEESKYAEFYNILMYLSTQEESLVQKTYDLTTGTSSDGITKSPKTVSNGWTINVMDNFNYTVYVPDGNEIKVLYDKNLLPDWREVEKLSKQVTEGDFDDETLERMEARLNALNDSLENFIRYHIQNNAVYLHAHATSDGAYESSFMQNGRFATLSLSGTGNHDTYNITCLDYKGEKVSDEPRHVLEGNHFAREYRFRTGVSDNDTKADSQQPRCSDISTATRIYNSSSVVVHLIDKPLLYDKKLAEAYEQ